MTDHLDFEATPRCGICDEAIADQERTIVTAMATLHVSCVEESAAAA
jgi:hypothetical protein